MAPKKEKRTKEKASPSAAVATATGRLTRSVARLDKTKLPPVHDDPEPRRKKAKTTPSTSSSADAEAAAEAEGPQPTRAGKEQVSEPEVPDGSKTIIIEHCKQCNSFKTRATQVKNELEKSVAGVKVVLNPEKPRKGCFEIREEGGEVFVSLLDMKRPFPPLKELDMEKVISDIVEKIK